LFVWQNSVAVCSVSSGSERSIGRIVVLPIQAAATYLSLSLDRELRITWAPNALNARANYSPMPEEAPVINICLSRNRGFVNQNRLYLK
jgi:hypothetical protein